MADLIDEIGEDMRQQQLARFWRENARWILGGAVLAVVLTGAMHMWRAHQESYDMKETAAVVQALGQRDAEGLLRVAGETDAEHGLLARLAAARIAADAGKTSEAVEVYETVSKEGGLKPVYRDLGLLLSVSTRLNDKTLKAAELEDLLDTLKPLTAQKSAEKTPWRYSALEVSALIKARLNKKQDAIADLAVIIEDARAPQDLRQRALRLHDDYAAHL